MRWTPIQFAAVWTEALLILYPMSAVKAQVGSSSRLHRTATGYAAQVTVATLEGKDGYAKEGIPRSMFVASSLTNCPAIHAVKGAGMIQDAL